MAASIKLNINIKLARSAGAFLLTFLYRKAPIEGPMTNARVVLAVNLIATDIIYVSN